KLLTAAEDIFSPARSDVRAYPNPAIEEVNFELANLPASNYTIKIYNMLGSVVWKETNFVLGSKTIKANISALQKGSYLYNVTDSNGKVHATRRLIVLRP
ncbi:MAG: hypothetical protein RLZZ292_2591, partial [Bacteroidota bacterium]